MLYGLMLCAISGGLAFGSYKLMSEEFRKHDLSLFVVAVVFIVTAFLTHTFCVSAVKERAKNRAIFAEYEAREEFQRETIDMEMRLRNERAKYQLSQMELQNKHAELLEAISHLKGEVAKVQSQIEEQE